MKKDKTTRRLTQQDSMRQSQRQSNAHVKKGHTGQENQDDEPTSTHTIFYNSHYINLVVYTNLITVIRI